MRSVLIATSMLASIGVAGNPGPVEADTVVRVGISLGPGHAHRAHPQYRSHRATRQIGYERGHMDGLRQGDRDRDRHRRYEPWRHSRYRKANSGYRDRYGPRHLYASGYRAGYEAGYRRGFGVSGPWRHGRGSHYRGRIIYEAPPYWRHR